MNVTTLFNNLHVATSAEATNVANLIGAIPGYPAYWLAGITSDQGRSPGDFFGIGWEFDNTFNYVGGSSGWYSIPTDSPWSFGGIFAIYYPDNYADTQPVPEPSSNTLLFAGLSCILGMLFLKSRLTTA